jgi:hypothetical protein
MKQRIADALCVLGVCAIWICFILYVTSLASCNSTKHVQSSEVTKDSFSVHHSDSSAVNSSQSSDKFSNERIMEWLFNKDLSPDSSGKVINNYYPTSFKVIERSTGESNQANFSAVQKKDDDTTGKKETAVVKQVDKHTEAFSKWWLVAVFAIGVAIPSFFFFFKISKR